MAVNPRAMPTGFALAARSCAVPRAARLQRSGRPGPGAAGRAPPQRLTRVLACGLAVLLLSSCTSTFVYNRLDTLASWYFEDLVSLNDDQRHAMRDWLERTLSWHRTSELGRYARFLNDIAAQLAQPGSPTEYEQVRDRFDGLVDDLTARTAPDATRLLQQLSPAQVDEFMESLEEKSRNSADKNAAALAKGRWKADQVRRFTDQTRRWVGSVSEQQRRLIENGLAAVEPTHVEWADSQRAWREALRAALRSDAEGGHAVSQLLQDPDSTWSPEYTVKVAHNRQRYLSLLALLDASLSKAQRDHLRAELHKLAQQVTKLAKSPS